MLKFGGVEICRTFLPADNTLGIYRFMQNYIAFHRRKIVRSDFVPVIAVGRKLRSGALV